MKSLSILPNGYDEVVRVYGNPDANNDGIPDPIWKIGNLKLFKFPEPMRIAWGKHGFVTYFRAHRLVGDVIVDALDEIFDQVGILEMRAKTWDYWGGCYCFRLNSNAKTPKLSTHSWAIACDINPHLAPNGVKECGQPIPIIRAFKSRGFVWAAGDWMHAQACINF